MSLRQLKLEEAVALMVGGFLGFIAITALIIFL